MARALAYDGLENVLGVLALNGGSHVAPSYAGDTICCATTVLERIPLPNQRVGALRLRTVAAKNLEGAHKIIFPVAGTDKALAPSVVLDLDYTVTIPRKI